MSTKLGYKYFDKKLNVTIGGNYVIGLKEGNGFWDDGEALIIDRNGIWNPGEDFIDNNSNEKYDEGEIFIDAITNNIYDYLNSDQYEDWTDCNDDFSICEDHDNWDDEIMGNHFWNEGETWIDEGANETYDYLNSDQYEDWTDCNNDFSICEDGDNWDDETMGNQKWDPGEPLASEKRLTLIQHLEHLYRFYGARDGVRIARKHFSWYVSAQGGDERSRRLFCAAADPVPQLRIARSIQFAPRHRDVKSDEKMAQTAVSIG